jgi:hypothetical protein
MRLLTALWAFSICASALDLRRATVVATGSLSPREKAAVTMLVEEVEKRTQIRWPIAAATGPHLTIAHSKGPAEGFHLAVRGDEVRVDGSDERGILFGIGRLLREMRMEKGVLEIADNLDITSAPKYPLRGHQLGYRPKTNSYDGWDVATWEQYIRDLAIFGTNAIELIPPRSDDAADSPHFPLPPMRMMIEMSRLADKYGLDVWIWYPAMDKDYGDPKTVDFALKEWAELFEKLPRIDAIFVPGGDPGHTQPKHLMALLEKQTASLHKFHPKAQMWMSPQGFDAAWMDEFLGIMRGEPAWLSGIVFGPQIRMSLPKLREAIPKKYPIRHYPDITHSKQSQYPVPDWDIAYAVTESREVINPRPIDQSKIFRLLQPYTMGFLTYSEGCNDDVNKFIWSALGWDPNANVLDILREYSRYFIGEKFTDDFANVLLALERNWRGPLLTNEGVYVTLAQAQGLERAASPATLANWRFQQMLYRAYYDAYTRKRLLFETAAEQRAMDLIRAGDLNAADASLDQTMTSDPWRARCFELAEALFQSIRMQLSVEKYKAISVDRGATLDTIDYPLNNRVWLKAKLVEVRAISDVPARRKAIDELLNWTNPGPGGFYDDLGNLTAQPHLVRGSGFDKDPAFLESSLVSFLERATYRTSVRTFAESLNDAPLQMHYDGLDPHARYKLRVIYGGDSPNRKMRLVANGKIEIHPLLAKPVPYSTLEFDLPAEATASGELNLAWTRDPGLGGNGRGCQVAEVWLIKK